jgi:hypothetical protein
LLPLGLDRTAADSRRGRSLRRQREGERRVSGHPLDDRHQPIRVVARACHQFERVAVRAPAHVGLLRVGAGKAGEPFRVGELRRDIARLLQRQVSRRGPPRVDRDGGGTREVVTDRTDVNRVLAWLESPSGKPVPPLLIGDDARRHGGSGLLGADDDALHRAFLDGGDRSDQGNRLIVLREDGARRRLTEEDEERQKRRGESKSSLHGRSLVTVSVPGGRRPQGAASAAWLS